MIGYLLNIKLKLGFGLHFKYKLLILFTYEMWLGTAALVVFQLPRAVMLLLLHKCLLNHLKTLHNFTIHQSPSFPDYVYIGPNTSLYCQEKPFLKCDYVWVRKRN